MFPSPADGAMESGQSPGRVYPDLGDLSAEESDPLPPLQASVSKFPPPKRPPPPRSSSVPTNISSVPKPTPSAVSSLTSASVTGAASPGAQKLKIPPLRAHEVRWFYEEPGKTWTPFNGHNSLCLEDCYRKLRNKRNSSECCEVSVLGDMYEANLLDKLCRPIYWEDKPWKIMRGTWFEVGGSSEKWYPLDEQESTRIELEHCRDGWRNKASDMRLLKQTSATDSSKTNDVVVNKLSLEKYDVLWMASKAVHKQKKEITSQLWSMVGEKLGKGLAYGAARLQRGYKEAASHEHREPPVGHLVLIVHGIGQNMEASDISKDTATFRSACVQVAKKHFLDDWSQKRVEFLPCEWRTWLTLDKGLLNLVTPQGLKKVRGIINDTFIDVMYYMSPTYGPEILDGLRFCIHKQYNTFMKRNPHFNGSVSFFAHSLGSVLVYDLLVETCRDMGVDHCDVDSNTEGASSGTTDESSSQKRAVKSDKNRGVRYHHSAPSIVQSSSSSQQQQLSTITEGEDEIDFKVGGGEGEGEGEMVNETQWSARVELDQLRQRVAELEAQLGLRKKRGLCFTVDHFFAVGSPLPLFLVMKEHDCLIKKGHRGAASLLPTCICKRVHNVHHPSDPIAYRLEPLIHDVYAQVKPVRMDSAGSRPTKDMVDLAEGPREEKTPAASKGWSFGLFSSSKKTEPPPQPKVPENVVDDDKTLRLQDRLKERLDFMLRESMAESSYLNSIKAHFGYWSSQDCAQYILLQIYSYKQTDL